MRPKNDEGSRVIDNNEEVIVNVNDCPFEMANHIASKIKRSYPNIDLLLLGYSGASAYPHCYELPLQEKWFFFFWQFFRYPYDLSGERHIG